MSYSHRQHTETHSHHAAVTPPVELITDGDRPGTVETSSITGVTVWWERRWTGPNASEWFASCAATLGSFPYSGKVLLSLDAPQLLDMFADLIAETDPTERS